MTGGRRNVKHLEGRVNISDAGIEELMRKGQWDSQIREKYKVGLPRLRRIRKEVEKKET